MAASHRIGIQIDHADPFWVQVREVIWQRARARGIELVEVALRNSKELSLDQQIEAAESMETLGISALVCNTFPRELLERIIARGLPIIYVSESPLSHPRFVSRSGLAEAGAMLGELVASRLAQGDLLMVGGKFEGDDYGLSRISGFLKGVGPASRLRIHHVPAPWVAEQARPHLEAWLAANPALIPGAIFGLSDPLALMARAVCAAAGRLTPATLVVGVNGDPMALAAINAGHMLATVDTDLEDIAEQALGLAYDAARGRPLPATFSNRQCLISAANLAETAVRKLLSLADLPSSLVGSNLRYEQQRLTQIETSVAIDQQIGLILDERQLSLAITALIRDSYGFEHARLLLWDPQRELLDDVGAAQRGPGERPDPAGPLAYALSHNQPVLIPDTSHSQRFPADPRWPSLRARAVVPVHLGGQVIGLLDLHRARATPTMREELIGLQLLADQLGIAIRNAQLYGHEQEARALAEQADRIKTTLLANVSHELRTPLNVILGYSRGALDLLARGEPAPADLADDLAQIYSSGEHLLRLINDLLDLSRAEIGELDLMPERIATGAFLAEVFRSSAESFGTGTGVAWRQILPPDLPPIEADPVRLRQILLNLLHNAHKFTERGAITMGAEVAGRELRLWVADTGPGIAPELHEQIFDPFVSGRAGPRPHAGIGLGLSITRRLVALHRGRLTLTSEVGRGSTFQISLPLPDPAPPAPTAEGEARRVLLVISAAAATPAPIAQLAERRGLAPRLVRPGDSLAGALQGVSPALLAWDVTTTAEDGWRVIEGVRGRPELRQLPVVIYSGGGDLGDAAATGVLLKPLGDDVLLEALRDLAPAAPGGSILIVEDDPQVRAQHRRLIAQRFPAYTLDEVGDGAAALASIAERPPSLLVLDLMIPAPDGFAVLEALRADPRTTGIPVLVLSGKALAGEDLRRLSEARVIFHTKDLLSADELAAALQRAISPDERLPQHTSAMVKQAIAYIQQQHAEPLSRQAIADAVGVHKDYLGRIFQHELGLSPWEYLIRYRVLRAKGLLRETDLTVAEVAARVGFDTPTYFSQVFNREVGCSPRAFRTRQRR